MEDDDDNGHANDDDAAADGGFTGNELHVGTGLAATLALVRRQVRSQAEELLGCATGCVHDLSTSLCIVAGDVCPGRLVRGGTVRWASKGQEADHGEERRAWLQGAS